MVTSSHRECPHSRRLQVRTLRLFRRVSARGTRCRASHDGWRAGCAGDRDIRLCLRPAAAQKMPAGMWELVCHPGYVDAALGHAGTRLIKTRGTERLALLDALQSPSLDLPRIELIHYGELTG